MGSPAATISIRVGDPTFTCICPPGTLHLAKDLIMAATMEKGVTWLHRPCKPFSAAGSLLQLVEDAAALPRDDGMDLDSEAERAVVPFGGTDQLTALLGPDPSPAALAKVMNFTKKFICDGPCESARKKLADYFLCKKCLSWQHKDCMIFGEQGDRGAPVCNHCYMDFLAHHEEVDRWQRRRLMEAVQEALMFMTDPDTSHEVWRREWCKKFVRRFFVANKGLFVKFVAARRRAQQIARQQGIYDPAYFPQNRYQAALTFTPPPKDEDEEGDAGAQLEVISLASSDNIIVRNPGTKVATKTFRKEVKKRVRKRSPSLPGGGRRPHRKILEGTKSPKTNVKATPKSKAKGRPRKKQRRASPSPEPESEERSRSPVRGRQYPGKPHLTEAARKSVRVSNAAKKPVYVVDSDNDHEASSSPAPEAQARGRSPVRGRRGQAKPQFTRQARKSAPSTGNYKTQAEMEGLENDEDDSENEDENEDDEEDDEYELKVNSEDEGVDALLDEIANDDRSFAGLFSYDVGPGRLPLNDDYVNKIMELCPTVLWKEYSSLPSPKDDDEGYTPSSAETPPEDWLEECETRLMNMLVAAGAEKIVGYLRPLPKKHDAIIEVLMDLARWLVRKGPWRGDRAALGLMGEVLGLDDKGRYWQGGGF